MKPILILMIAMLGSLVFAENVSCDELSPFGAPPQQVREHFEHLPKDAVWWSREGEDMRWNNLNLQLMFPTAPVYRSGAVRALETDSNAAIPSFPVDTPGGPMPFAAFLDSEYSTALGVVIAHRGKLVFEHYPRMQAMQKPIAWSVSKVLVSTVIAILEARGVVEVDEAIETYIPALEQSSWAGVTVRNLLDMASGIDCPEDYSNRDSCYGGLMQAMGETWWDENSPKDPYKYLATVRAKRIADQGTSFDYASVNTDILGWLVEEVTGMPFQDALSREIWTQAGMEADAAYVAPRFGVPHWDGGFLVRMRDMLRFGLLFTPSYRVVSDQRLVPESHVAHLLEGGRPGLLVNARWPGWKSYTHQAESVRHNVYQWDLVWSNGDIYKAGWAGQGLLINPKKDLVAYYTGYFGENRAEIPLLPALRELLNALYPE